MTYEESPSQLIRNMRSIGINLDPWVKNGLLTFHAARALQQGVEGHLTAIQEAVRIANPDVAVIDPISSLTSVGDEIEVTSMLVRITDHLRANGVTTLVTNQVAGGNSDQMSGLSTSSMADTLILLRVLEQNAERNNVIQVLKSRGMSHSKLVREFNFTKAGISIVDAYISVDSVIIGSARHGQEAKDRLRDLRRREDVEVKRRKLGEKRRAVDAQIEVLEADYQAEMEALEAEVQSLEKI